jgi:predicted metal-dependent phosphoesterase TrpH
MIDLHCHSTASDGTLSPAELVRAADACRLEAVALTDHDTLAGIPAFLEAGRNARVGCVPGVEVASRTPAGEHIHLLGLFVDHANPGLRDLLAGVRRRREERNAELLRRLEEHGYAIDPAVLGQPAAAQVIGRPHIAAALVEAGYFRHPQEAFDRFLGRGRPGYIPRIVPSPAECLAALRRAGAVTVWAHPMVSNSMTNAKMNRIAAALREEGLDALEAYYPEHSERNTEVVLTACRQLGLLASGGSDFHGGTMPAIALGAGRGDLRVPAGLLPPLRQLAARRRGQGAPLPAAG